MSIDANVRKIVREELEKIINGEPEKLVFADKSLNEKAMIKVEEYIKKNGHANINDLNKGVRAIKNAKHARQIVSKMMDAGVLVDCNGIYKFSDGDV